MTGLVIYGDNFQYKQLYKVFHANIDICIVVLLVDSKKVTYLPQNAYNTKLTSFWVQFVWYFKHWKIFPFGTIVVVWNIDGWPFLGVTWYMCW